MTVYNITSFSNNYIMMSYLSSLPNYIDAEVLSGKTDTIQTEFNHTTNADIKSFLYVLAQVTDGTVVIDPQGVNKVVTLSSFNINLRNDVPVITHIYNTQLNNLSTTYTNVFANAVKNLRFPYDTNGFSKFGVVIMWNKNGGTSNHDVKLVDYTDETKIIKEFTNIQTDTNEDFNIDIETIESGFFTDKIGFAKLMAKSANGTDDPIIIGLNVYLRR